MNNFVLCVLSYINLQLSNIQVFSIQKKVYFLDYSVTSNTNSYDVYHILENLGSDSKRLCFELRHLERLELENKFILNSDSLDRLKSAESTGTYAERFICGRIFPQTEPYCRRSFLVKIKLLPEYPFKVPEIIFLDHIYHPSVNEQGRNQCDWHNNSGVAYDPTTTLVETIENVIRIIDKIYDEDFVSNDNCAREYREEYAKFYKKALEMTLLHGRPRQ